MTRAAVFLISAVLALVLVYPASTSSARSPYLQDTPAIQIITPQDGAYTPAYTGTGSGGDADDLAGAKDRKPVGTPRPSDFLIEARFAFEAWWMHFLTFEICR